jgi:hypothetical protein
LFAAAPIEMPPVPQPPLDQLKDLLAAREAQIEKLGKVLGPFFIFWLFVLLSHS